MRTTYPDTAAILRATFSAQLVCGGTGGSALLSLAAYGVKSKPSHAGTLAISDSGTTSGAGEVIYSVVGTGTDFTVLTADTSPSVGDFIYCGVGKPLFWVYSITDATHMKVVLLLESLANVMLTMPVSGWTFTAYRHGAPLVLVPGADVRGVAASAVQDVTFRGGVTVSGNTGEYSGIIVIAQASSSVSINAKRSMLDSQWVVATA